MSHHQIGQYAKEEAEGQRGQAWYRGWVMGTGRHGNRGGTLSSVRRLSAPTCRCSKGVPLSRPADGREGYVQGQQPRQAPRNTAPCRRAPSTSSMPFLPCNPPAHAAHIDIQVDADGPCAATCGVARVAARARDAVPHPVSHLPQVQVAAHGIQLHGVGLSEGKRQGQLGKVHAAAATSGTRPLEEAPSAGTAPPTADRPAPCTPPR